MSKYLAALLTISIGESCLASDAFTIDPNHTLPVFEINHLGFSTQRGRFDKTSGTAFIDAAAKKGVVDFSIEAASINMGQEKWNDHLKSADFFNVAKFPTITFRSNALTFDGDKPIAAEGTLTMLGIAKKVNLDILRYTCGINPIALKSLCAADIEAHIKRSDFGMTKYLPGVGDEVKVMVPVEAYKQ